MYPDDKLKDIVSELLETGKDATYLRLNGKKELSFTELEKICHRFNISADEIMNMKTKHNIEFSYRQVSDESSYIDHILQSSDTLHSIRSVSEKELLLTAEDIPFYHFLKYPELAIFRIYAWHSTQYRNNDPFSKFYSSSENNGIISLYEKIYDDYIHIPSKEVWTLQTIDTTLRMLQYYYDSGHTDRDTALHLAGQLMNLLDTLQQHASAGCRQNEAKTPFALYHCHVDVENDFVMLRLHGKRSCFTKLFAINGVVMGNETICSETQQWIESLILKSILISGDVALKEQFQFFNTLKHKVQKLVKALKS
jgi:uncharacterized protein YlxP (DUF503 family)